MSATISTVKEATGGLYSKQSILAAIERAFGNRDQAEFTISVDGQESIIIREAMRRYCAPSSKAEEILAAITPEGFQYDSHEDSTKWPSYLHCQRVVNFRRIAPPVEYEYVASDKPRMQMRGDYELLSDGKFHLADLHPPTEGIYFRRVEVKR